MKTFNIEFKEMTYEVKLGPNSVSSSDKPGMAHVTCTVNSEPLNFDIVADEISEPYDVAYAAVLQYWFTH